MTVCHCLRLRRSANCPAATREQAEWCIRATVRARWLRRASFRPVAARCAHHKRTWLVTSLVTGVNYCNGYKGHACALVIANVYCNHYKPPRHLQKFAIFRTTGLGEIFELLTDWPNFKGPTQLLLPGPRRLPGRHPTRGLMPPPPVHAFSTHYPALSRSWILGRPSCALWHSVARATHLPSLRLLPISLAHMASRILRALFSPPTVLIDCSFPRPQR